MTILVYIKKDCDEIPVQCRDIEEAKAKAEPFGPDARIEVDGQPYVEEAPAEAPAAEPPKPKAKKAKG